jgi:GNAT superfamily N-acetyltransferase
MSQCRLIKDWGSKYYVDLDFISVNESYRRKGLGKNLILKIFNYCSINKMKLNNSAYTDMGKLYLEHIYEDYKKLYPDVQFLIED